ncbi:MAG: hypothetical protein KBT29_07725, partial [Prevotellaceae bacterium]|nr:hypothetical protein [Candidatus Minthosoma caballi]
NKNRIRLTESQLHRVIKESVNKVLKEATDTSNEVEEIVSSMGSSIEEWYTDNNFIDTHGCEGFVFDDAEDATNAILNGFEHQNAIDYVNGAQSDEDWIQYLIRGGVDKRTAIQIIQNNDWEQVVQIIVDKAGPEWFLSQYSGEVHSLSNGQLLYY